jgi:hypothetical protein
MNPCLQLLGRLRSAAVGFVSAPASARPLAVFRIGVAAVLLLQALAVGGKLTELYGERGIIQWSVADDLAPEGMPRVRWLADLLGPYGISADACLRGVFLAYVAGLAALLVGWHTRPAAVLAWLTHLALTASGSAATYGVDQFAVIALFYCVCMPVGDAASADRCAGRTSGAPSAEARLSLRVLQFHLGVVYLSSGLEKATGEQWRNGEAIWRAVNSPAMEWFDFGWLAHLPWLAVLVCWGTLVVEIGYPLFMAWPRTRKLWVLATVGLHLGIALTMGLLSFSAMMIVLTVAAFGVSPRPLPVRSAAHFFLPAPARTMSKVPVL